MDLRIPNIIKPIALKDYTEGRDFPPEYENIIIWVWVNPRKELRTIFINDILSGDASDEQVGKWFSEVWSQGPEDTHFTADEVVKLATLCAEYEPGFWSWIIRQTSQLITEHYISKKKNLTTPP